MTNPPLHGLVKLRERHGFKQHQLAEVQAMTDVPEGKAPDEVAVALAKLALEGVTHE